MNTGCFFSVSLDQDGNTKTVITLRNTFFNLKRLDYNEPVKNALETTFSKLSLQQPIIKDGQFQYRVGFISALSRRLVAPISHVDTIITLEISGFVISRAELSLLSKGLFHQQHIRKLILSGCFQDFESDAFFGKLAASCSSKEQTLSISAMNYGVGFSRVMLSQESGFFIYKIYRSLYLLRACDFKIMQMSHFTRDDLQKKFASYVFFSKIAEKSNAFEALEKLKEPL